MKVRDERAPRDRHVALSRAPRDDRIGVIASLVFRLKLHTTMKLGRHSGGAQHAHPESSLDRNPIFNGSWIASRSRAVQDDEVSWKGTQCGPTSGLVMTPIGGTAWISSLAAGLPSSPARAQE